MKMYFDRISDDMMLVDHYHPFKEEGKRHSFEELQNGMIWKVEGKMVNLFQGMINMGLMDVSETTSEDMVVNLVSRFSLRELEGVDEAMLRAKIKEFVDQLTPMLLGEEKKIFPKYMPAATEFLVNNLHKFKVYTTRRFFGSLVFQYRDNPTTLLYLAYGLYGLRTK